MIKHLSLLLTVLAFISCKKESNTVVNCSIASISNSGATTQYEYDSHKRISRMSGSNGGYTTYTYDTDTTLTITAYNSSNIITNTSQAHLNSKGFITNITSGSESVVVTYNSDDQLTEYQHNLNGSIFTYRYYYTNGDLSTITASNGTITYTDTVNSLSAEENKTGYDNTNLSFESTTGLYGKFSRHLVTSYSSAGNTYVFTFSFDENHYPLQYTMTNGSSGVTIQSFSYNCP